MSTNTLLKNREQEDPTLELPEIGSAADLEGVRFMRGMLFAVALSLPLWGLIIVAIAG